ncbi:hypothetical protein GMRT_10180 [Giardia muris]|uniref:Uncharacterized protein n=1 Tax=Giardia muris TaxID=5742 RepID=A0A4Z1SM51_GIAMU|nr:hypothetical protein GMRT_10180 [Giardia muris]|eukprot:TNJ26752.1 hypothetical protein GMRT_10180 [Giardia muris]
MVFVSRICYLCMDPPSCRGSYLFSLRTGQFYTTTDDSGSAGLTLLVDGSQIKVCEVPAQSYFDLLGGLTPLDMSVPIPESMIWSILQRVHRTIEELDGQAAILYQTEEGDIESSVHYEYGDKDDALFALGVLTLCLMTVSPFTRVSQYIENLVLDLLEYDFTLESTIYTAELINHITSLCALGKRIGQVESPRCISMVSTHPLIEVPMRNEDTSRSHLQEHVLFAKPEVRGSKRVV